MEIGGVDIIFFCPSRIDVLPIVLEAVRQHWPNLTYDAENVLKNEYFIYEDSKWGACCNEGKDDDFLTHYIHLICGEDEGGQRTVTVVVENLKDDVLFNIVNDIQTKILQARR